MSRMGVFFVLCDNFIIFVSVSRAKHKLEDFWENEWQRMCVICAMDRGLAMRIVKKVSLMPERVKHRGDGVCEDVEGYFSIALMSLRLPSFGAGVTPMRWHRSA